ncbi:MAG: hypothetical protein LBQ15_06215 [Clostridium sp.]|jgi:hypothetical protein|nr:hypothetical protein [Clostridium sp.]
MKEIGSEFWECTDQGFMRTAAEASRYFLSGRTALEFLIRDMLQERRIKRMCLPSYCCYTMIEPFARHGLEIRFYDVFPREDGGLVCRIPEALPDEGLYLLRYFGYTETSTTNPETDTGAYAVRVEDRTHSCLSGAFPGTWTLESSMAVPADYIYASYRKWVFLSGAAEAVKAGGAFRIPYDTGTHGEYVALRNRAAQKKKEYICRPDESGISFAGQAKAERAEEEQAKEEFLRLYGQAEALLEKDYVGYAPEKAAREAWLRCDLARMKETRRENARFLTERLKGLPQVRLLYPTVGEEDCPLFVPILLEKQERGDLKAYLSDRQVYCPIHWPLSAFHTMTGRALRLYEEELSLVCDQRYLLSDMERIVRTLEEYFSRQDKKGCASAWRT